MDISLWISLSKFIDFRKFTPILYHANQKTDTAKDVFLLGIFSFTVVILYCNNATKLL